MLTPARQCSAMPETERRHPDLPKDGLDLVRLHGVMNGIENFFECVDADFTHKADCAAEYL